MQNNRLLINGEDLLRVLDERDEQTLVIDTQKESMPKWVSSESLAAYQTADENRLGDDLQDVNEMSGECRKQMHRRFSLIAGVLPFVTDKQRRCDAIRLTAEQMNVSPQTVKHYLWCYLSRQSIAALAPRPPQKQRELTEDEKNFRWALNRFYYTRHCNHLTTAYTMMLSQRYCDKEGKLVEPHPSFYQFRYFYRKTCSKQTQFISRDGIKEYQRNRRPLLGDRTESYAPAIGVGLLDATVCDVYLADEGGATVGRPILTACVDAYSGMCCGYALSWEGGLYSLRSLLSQTVSDKVQWCKRFGIEISQEDWNCAALPATLVTDMGREYTSDTFEQIADLGVTVVNLPPYRPELKGTVEKFFDVVQNLYKPHLKGKGVIEPDFRQRGARDYRKDACLTMHEFETVLLHCILYYNTHRVLEHFPFTGEMVRQQIKPYANCIWNRDLAAGHGHLIPTDREQLMLTLLPRTAGRFTRKGLSVNGLRYRADGFTERYLSGGSVTVAVNPDDVSMVWLLEKGNYTRFCLIDSRFEGMELTEVEQIKDGQKALLRACAMENTQARIDLAEHIGVICSSAKRQPAAETCGIRANRKREQQRAHTDCMKEVTV